MMSHLPLLQINAYGTKDKKIGSGTGGTVVSYVLRDPIYPPPYSDEEIPQENKKGPQVIKIRPPEANKTYPGDKRVAIKMPDEFRPDTMQEIASMLLLRKHPGIMQLIDIISPIEEIFPLYLVMPLGNGTLYSFSRENAGNLNIDQLIKYSYQICHVVCWVNSHGIAHRDIKSENFIYYSDSDRFVLADFGLSTVIHHPAFNIINPEIYTCMYRGPELLLSSNKDIFGLETDMWALGCVLFELIFAKTLFPGKNNKGVFSSIANRHNFTPATYPGCDIKIKKHGYKKVSPLNPLRTIKSYLSDLSPPNAELSNSPKFIELINLTSDLLNVDALQRIKYHQVINHPVFSDFKCLPIEARSSIEILDIYCFPTIDIDATLGKGRIEAIRLFISDLEEGVFIIRTVHLAIEIMDRTIIVNPSYIDYYREIIYLAHLLNEPCYAGLNDLSLFPVKFDLQVLEHMLRILNWNLFISTPFDYLMLYLPDLPEKILVDNVVVVTVDFLNDVLLHSLTDIRIRKYHPKELAETLYKSCRQTYIDKKVTSLNQLTPLQNEILMIVDREID